MSVHYAAPEVLNLANEANKRGDYQLAEQISNAVLQTSNLELAAADIVSALLVLSLSQIRRGIYDQACNNAHKALEIAIAENNQDLIARASNGFGLSLYYATQYNRAIEYYEQSLKILRQLNKEIEIAKVLMNLANVYYTLSDYPYALTIYFDALSICLEQKEELNAARVTGNIGNIYYALSEHSKALEYYHKALGMYEQLGMKGEAAKIKGNIGGVYTSMEYYEKALEYHFESLDDHQQLGMKNDIARVKANIGTLYFHKKEYVAAAEFYTAALQIYTEVQNSVGIARLNTSIAHIHILNQDYSQALMLLENSCNTFLQMGLRSDYAMTLSMLGLIYNKQDNTNANPVLAEKYLLNALEISTELGDKKTIRDIHRELKDLYKVIKDFEKYAYHFEHMYMFEKQLINEETHIVSNKLEYERKTAEAEKKYLVDRARLEEREAALEEMQILNQSLMESVLRSEQLNEQLTIANTMKNEILGVVAHDLRNPLCSVILNAETQLRFAGRFKEEHLTSTAKRILITARRMNLIVNNLLDIEALENGKLSVIRQIHDIKPIVLSAIDEYTHKAAEKNISIISSIPDILPPVQCDPNGTYRILDNLISNALKYSFPDSQIVCTCMENMSEGFLEIFIRDYGLGISVLDQERLFKKFQKLSARPTGGEHSTGLGLSISKALAQQMGGDVYYQRPSDNKGSVFVLRLITS
jgi:signal transduction histidine kinase